MNKIKFLMTAVFAAALVFSGNYIEAQTPGNTSILRTTHYELVAEAGAVGSLPSLANELEMRFEVFNDLFRFNPALLPGPLRVRVFTDQNTYDAYIAARLGTTRSGAVYLHYNQFERRELIILRGSPDEAAMLAHQSFIQFLRGFIPNPPTWIREGFSIYFNSLRYDPEEHVLRYEENLAWLETVKNLGDNILSPREIFLADTIVLTAAASGAAAARFSRDFQICSWSLVSFFLNSGDYFRTLTESFMVLSPSFSAEENSRAVADRFSMWTNMDTLERDFFEYLESRRTFTELMERGRQFYDEGDMMRAEFAFLAAHDQRPAHYAPLYFLGLIYYEEELFDMAEEFYLMSKDHGADEALVSYALGINAASANRHNDARQWLERASELDPARYSARVQDLLRRLR